MVGECDECGEESEMSMCPECESVLCENCMGSHDCTEEDEDSDEYEDFDDLEEDEDEAR